MGTMTELREQLYQSFRAAGMNETAARLAADVDKAPGEELDVAAQFEAAARQPGFFGAMSESAAQAYAQQYRADVAAAERLAEPRQPDINRNKTRLHEQTPARFSPRHEEIVKRAIRNRRQEGKNQ